MPLCVILGCQIKRAGRAKELLYSLGARPRSCKVEKDVQRQVAYVRGIFDGIADPSGQRADMLVDELNVDMKKPRYVDIWLDEVEPVE